MKNYWIKKSMLEEIDVMLTQYLDKMKIINDEGITDIIGARERWMAFTSILKSIQCSE